MCVISLCLSGWNKLRFSLPEEPANHQFYIDGSHACTGSSSRSLSARRTDLILGIWGSALFCSLSGISELVEMFITSLGWISWSQHYFFKGQFLLSNFAAVVNVNELSKKDPPSSRLNRCLRVLCPKQKGEKSLESLFSSSFQGISLHLLEMEIFTPSRRKVHSEWRGSVRWKVVKVWLGVTQSALSFNDVGSALWKMKKHRSLLAPRSAFSLCCSFYSVFFAVASAILPVTTGCPGILYWAVWQHLDEGSQDIAELAPIHTHTHTQPF